MASKASRAARDAAKAEKSDDGAGKETKEAKRAARASSNVFSMFKQQEIQEYKEAFTMIDQNRDGFIDVEDLKDMYASLGRIPDDKVLDAMVKEAPGPLNFTMFLTIFGEKLCGTDPENTILNAFKMFDDENTGFLDEQYVRDLFEGVGDIFTKDEMKQTWKEAPISAGKFDYKAMVKLLKGQQDQEQQQ